MFLGTPADRAIGKAASVFENTKVLPRELPGGLRRPLRLGHPGAASEATHGDGQGGTGLLPWLAQELDPSPLRLRSARVGFQMCTEMLFTDLSWRIGRSGAQLLAAPRATRGHRRWMAAASLMAIVSGCFVASANRLSYDRDDFCGQSWIISPEGELLAERRPAARSRRSRSTSGAPIRPRRTIREISPCDQPLSGSRPRASSRTAGSHLHRPPPTPRDTRCRRWRCRPGRVALARRRPS